MNKCSPQSMKIAISIGGRKRKEMNKLAQWLKTNNIMLFNAGSICATTAVTSLLGFVYWWAATRWFPPQSIGVAAAAISAMTLLGQMCILGLGTLLTTELPRQPDKAGSLISTALIVVGIVGACAGLLFVYIAPYMSHEFYPLTANIRDEVIFVVGISLTAIILVLDQALIGLLRGGQRLWRNALFATAKLIALIVVGFWLSSRGVMSIYATWVFGNTISLVVLLLPLVLKKHWSVKNYLPRWELLRKLRKQALLHHFLNLALQAPLLILPILVTMVISAETNAWFYISWKIVTFVFIVPAALTNVLQAMGSAQPSTLVHRARVTIGIAFAVSVLTICVLQFAAGQVLGLFGVSYATQAAWCLRILLLALFPIVIHEHYLSICRIHDRIGQALLRIVPGALLELGGAALGAHLMGLVGLSIGWVAATYIEAIFMFGTVYKAVWAIEIPPTRTGDGNVCAGTIHLVGALGQGD
jgi:O-antigen/teichoic acid export membrane protein